MPIPGDEPEEAVDLTAAIRAVHQQLTAAIDTVRENEVLGFEYGDIELEFQMTATKTFGAQGGVRFYVFTAGGTAEQGSLASHRIKINIRPYNPETGDAARVAGPRP